MRPLITLLLCILQIQLFAQYPIVTIDDKTYAPNEPSIYINPLKPAQIVAGSNINNLYISNDTGKTWEQKYLRSSLGVYGDPVIYADEKGNFYFCHLAANKNKKYPHWIDKIVVQKSTNGGQDFSDGSSAGYNGDKEQDKHWIVNDQTNSAYKGNIYLSWTEFDKYESKAPGDYSRIRFARSRDGAKSFEQAITVSDTVGDCMDDDATLEGATPAIGKNGEVYLAWSGHGKIYFDKSLDGGVTWGKDKIIAIQDDGWALDFEHIFRSNGLPFLVADHSGGKYNGRLYLTWGENHPKIGGEIKLMYSDNGGETWSDEITVNTETKGDQFLPHIAVDQSDGMVYLVFYDRRNSTPNILMDVYVAFSSNGGLTFSNQCITPEPFLPAGKAVFFGDYNGISAHNGIVRPIWTGVNDNIGGKTIIQTALLSKDLLYHKTQVRSDTFFHKYYVGKEFNQFVLYSGKPVEYNIQIKVKRHAYLPFKVTYRSKGSLAVGDYLVDMAIKTIKGQRTDIQVDLNFEGKKVRNTFRVQ